MNPWLFIHSLWVRDPRDRAHLKALWARDERQRGLMRWLVLLIMPLICVFGCVDTSATLVQLLILCCAGLNHPWSSDGIDGAEFEGVLPARPRLRLQVLILGSILPLTLVACLCSVIHLFQPVLPGQEAWHLPSWLLTLWLCSLLFSGLNWILRHLALRLSSQLIGVWSIGAFSDQGLTPKECVVILSLVIFTFLILYGSAEKREIPSSTVSDFSGRTSQLYLAVPGLMILIPLMSGIWYWVEGVCSWGFHAFAIISSAVTFSPLLMALLAYLLIHWRRVLPKLMNPWLFFHSLWVRDPRDRDHLKALWARDERQRGLMRWLVLLILPWACWVGGIQNPEILVQVLLGCGVALNHPWTSEGINEAEFEATMPARRMMRLQVLILGSFLPLTLTAALCCGIHLLQPDQRGQEAWHLLSWIPLFLVSSLLFSGLNWILRHLVLRIGAQLLGIWSVAGGGNVEFELNSLMITLGFCLFIFGLLHLVTCRRETPNSTVSDLITWSSRFNLALPAMMMLFPVSLFCWIMVSECSRGWAAFKAVQGMLYLGLSPLVFALVAQLLIRWQVYCRRYFWLLLLVAYTLVFLYSQGAFS